MGKHGYRLFLALCAALIVLLLALRQKPLDWTLTLSEDRNTPFSAELLARHLPAYLPGRDVVRRDVPTSELLDTLRTPATVLLVTPAVAWEEATCARIDAFVRRGGRVVVIAEHVESRAVADSLGIRFGGLVGGNPLDGDDGDTLRLTMGTASLAVPQSLVQAQIFRPRADSGRTLDEFPDAFVVGRAVGDVPAFYDPGQIPDLPDEAEADDDTRSEEELDSLRAAQRPSDDLARRHDSLYRHDAAYRDSVHRADSLVGDALYAEAMKARAGHDDEADEAGEADENAPDVPDTLHVAVRVPVGQGAYVFFSAPRLLTNYGLRYASGDVVLRGLLAHIAPDGPVVWDAYARPDAVVSRMPLSYILQHPAFRPAWRTAFVAVLLAMAFRLRRRQRVIPVVEPPRNATVGFARVVSRLYYQRGDHGHLVRTLRRQFYGYARDALGVSIPPGAPAFAETVAARAAAPEEQVRTLVRRLDAFGEAESPSRDYLLALARDLDAFYAASPRGKP